MSSKSHDQNSIRLALARLFSNDSAALADSEPIAEKYIPLRLLGCEGQATVVVAKDVTLNRMVVLKIYHAGLSANEQVRILNEGRALASIDSPHVIRCLGVEQVDSNLILVLEFCEGCSLDEFVDQNKLGVDDVWALFQQLVRGAHSVHQLGLLHLDLKPQNVLVENGCTVKIIDFGLVRANAKAQDSGCSGTPAFMAPEVADSTLGTVDERTDIFGLGTILYFMLCGEAPFAGQSATSCKRRSSEGLITPLSRFDSSIPRNLERICSRCLERLPHLRFGSTTELLEAVESQVTPAKTPAIKILAVVALLVFAGIVWSLSGYFAADSAGNESGSKSQVSDLNRPTPLPTTQDLANYSKVAVSAWKCLYSGELKQAIEHQRIAMDLAKAKSIKPLHFPLAKSRLETLCELEEFGSDRRSLIISGFAKIKSFLKTDTVSRTADSIAELEQNLRDLRSGFENDNSWLLVVELFVINVLQEKYGIVSQRDRLVAFGERANRLGGRLCNDSIVFRERMLEIHIELGLMSEVENGLQSLHDVCIGNPGKLNLIAASARLRQARICSEFSPKKARRILQDAIRIWQSELGTDTVSTHGHYYDLASAYLELGDVTKAVEAANVSTQLFDDEYKHSEPNEFEVRIHRLLQAKLACAHAQLSVDEPESRDRHLHIACEQIATVLKSYAKEFTESPSSRAELELALSMAYHYMDRVQNKIEFTRKALSSISVGNEKSQNTLLVLTQLLETLNDENMADQAFHYAELFVDRFASDNEHFQPLLVSRGERQAARAFLGCREVRRAVSLVKQGIERAREQILIAEFEDSWKIELDEFSRLEEIFSKN